MNSGARTRAAGLRPAELVVSGPARPPALPSLAAALVGRVPLQAIDWPLRRMTGCLVRRHASLFARLGRHAASSFLIDPSDLPVAFLLCPQAPACRIETLRKPVQQAWDARIAGPLAALLGMVHGALDGDALFFSRDLVIEGDTEAVLALRNALDNAEIDLAAEAAAAFGSPALGPFAPHLEPLAHRVLREASRLTGVALTRPER